MNKEEIALMQTKMDLLQSSILEIATSKNKDVEIVMNGKLNIVEVKIYNLNDKARLEEELKYAFNEAVKVVSQKLQIAMTNLSGV